MILKPYILTLLALCYFLNGQSENTKRYHKKQNALLEARGGEARGGCGRDASFLLENNARISAAP